MRILHVLDHSLPMHSGYTFRTRAIMKAQARRGWIVAGITGARQTMPGPREFEEADGLEFYRTTPPPPAPSPFYEWSEVRALSRRIREASESFRPDVLHAHSPVIGALAALSAGRKLGIPVVYEIRAFWEDAAVGNGTGVEGNWRYRATRFLETHAVRRADAVVVICQGLKDDLIARGIDPAKIMVSPNGVDLTLFGEPVARDDALAGDLGLNGAEVLGFIGSFYPYEGLDDLIAAMPALVAARPNAHLLLVGGGPAEGALREQAAASGVGGHIHFTGRVPHHAVERYYSLVDVLVYPRKHMRLTDLVTPLKPLEAMAQYRLVAASDVGGHRELIRHGETGTLFPPDDPPAMARALAHLLEDRGGWPAMRERARAFVLREHDWDTNIARYQGVYERLTGVMLGDGAWLRSSPAKA